MEQLVEQFGHIDVYLFDQLLRGRITPDVRVLDAGCGGGRNLVYPERHRARTVGLDRDPKSAAAVRGAIDALPFPGGSFDCVICNAVLHFAPDEAGEALGASLLDSIKTTNVQGLRCMTTWVLGKPE